MFLRPAGNAEGTLAFLFALEQNLSTLPCARGCFPWANIYVVISSLLFSCSNVSMQTLSSLWFCLDQGRSLWMTGRQPTLDWLEEEDRVYVKDIDSKGAETRWAAWGTGIRSAVLMACVSSFFSASSMKPSLFCFPSAFLLCRRAFSAMREPGRVTPQLPCCCILGSRGQLSLRSWQSW